MKKFILHTNFNDISSFSLYICTIFFSIFVLLYARSSEFVFQISEIWLNRNEFRIFMVNVFFKQNKNRDCLIVRYFLQDRKIYFVCLGPN